ncbi:hypothetical protein CKO28_00585 [Rhodovibrio sodomensis]|uniref:Uncharacterized protein n=1 Tax=Rhodovibrio sodomensis TaxID=1088 RepID=A0ABS1D823_9PROT|nr:hypothetical protein [Rhodovibrio sodomensis]MBK1666537.1 hypothetical protein [Rhodovibrio sodomensis]
MHPPVDAPLTPQSEFRGPSRVFQVLHNQTVRHRPARPRDMIQDQARGRPVRPRREVRSLHWSLWDPARQRAHGPVAEIIFNPDGNGLLDIVPRRQLRMHRQTARSFKQAVEAVDAACARTFDPAKS